MGECFLIIPLAKAGKSRRLSQSVAGDAFPTQKVRKNLRQDTNALEFQTKVINIGTMPVVVMMSGLGLAVFKTRRRAAR